MVLLRHNEIIKQVVGPDKTFDHKVLIEYPEGMYVINMSTEELRMNEKMIELKAIFTKEQWEELKQRIEYYATYLETRAFDYAEKHKNDKPFKMSPKAKRKLKCKVLKILREKYGKKSRRKHVG